ncbi:MAG: hypothetical protein H5T49_00570 [Hadesarchaea archaeon]|nr:hypothetical protein [Hadesarchaea archaeon]
MRKNSDGATIVVKLPLPVVEFIDRLIKSGLYGSRAEAVSLLIQGYIDNLFRLTENEDDNRARECREIAKKQRGG